MKPLLHYHDPTTGDALRVEADAGRLVLEIHTEGGCAGLVLVDAEAQRKLAQALHREFGSERIAAVH